MPYSGKQPMRCPLAVRQGGRGPRGLQYTEPASASLQLAATLERTPTGGHTASKACPAIILAIGVHFSTYSAA